jgi:signal transduction histidine kinase/ActR/RegA family two-component response regulator
MERTQVRAGENVVLTDVPTLIRRIQRLAVTAILVAAIVVIAVILGAESKLSTENVIRAVDTDKIAFLAGLEEAIEFSDTEGRDFILNWVQDKHRLKSIGVVSRLPECRFPYSVGSFDVCWSIGSTVRAARPLAGGSYLAFETPVKLFTNAIVGPATALFVLVLATFVAILAVGIRRLGLAIHKPIMQLANAASKGEAISIKSSLLEIDALVRALQNLRDAEQYRAIASTTQMLAHDVRKPFSKMRSGLSLIAGAESPERMRSVAERLVPEVEAAIRSINGMLGDILEVGSSSARTIESVDPTELLKRSLEDVFRTHLNAEIVIEGDFRHDRMVSVDPLKMQRVIQNILENAVQAMKGRGRIWLSTATKDDGKIVQIRLGNSGSHIAPEDLPRLFETFFTKGKKGGTGLGLAIVKKIVEQHGGSISCSSDPAWGVEFTIELPASGPISAAIATLPTQAADYRLVIVKPKDKSDEPGVPLDRLQSSTATSENLARLLQGRGAPVKILAVDDEPMYLDYLRQIICAENQLAGRVEIETFENAASAIAKAITWPPDIAILDVDLANTEADGYALSKQLKDIAPKIHVCIHSNRISVMDSASACAAGASAFVPKPMTLAHFSMFLESSLLGNNRAFAGSPAPGRPIVAVVDDDVFVGEAWQSALSKDTDCFLFVSPSAFRRRFDQDTAFRDRLSVVVLDYFFDGTDESGATLAKEVRRASAAKIILGSDAELSRADLDMFDGVCGKTARKWTELCVISGGETATVESTM